MPLSSVCMYVCCQHFQQLLLTNHRANQSQISYEASMGWGNENLFNWSRSYDQDGRYGHIWGKNLKKIFFSGTNRSITLKLNLHHWVLKYYQVYSNDDTVLTLTYFMARSNLVPYAFVWENGKTTDFSKSFVVYDVEVGRCSKLND